MKWRQMLQGNCHPLFNFCIEVPVVWKSLRKNKTTCYQWGRTVPILVSSAFKKHHKKQDAEGKGHATRALLVAHDGLCLIADGGGKCRCSSLGSHPVGQLSVWAHPWERLLPVPTPPPLLLLRRISQMFLPEKAAAALNLPVSISLVVWLHPAVMELLIVPPFPSPFFHKDWAVVVRGREIILCLFTAFLLSPGCVAVPFPFFP